MYNYYKGKQDNCQSLPGGIPSESIGSAKNLLTKKGRDAIIFLPLVEGSFFCACFMPMKSHRREVLAKSQILRAICPNPQGGAEHESKDHSRMQRVQAAEL